jgi:hypothetical protein
MVHILKWKFWDVTTVKSFRSISASNSDMSFTSTIALATIEEIAAKDENSYLESACSAESSSFPWVFIFTSIAFSVSLAAFSLISISYSQITAVSRVEDLLVSLLVGAVREAWTNSRSHARLALASSEV